MTELPLDVLRSALDEHDSPDAAAAALLTHPERLTLLWRNHLQGFSLDVLDRRADALARLDLLHLACITVGLEFERCHVPAAEEADDARVNVLRQLWGVSIEAGGEIIALLRAGYPNGAAARWRLLRETEVLSLFVAQQPPAVAESYLRHVGVKALQLRHDYQAYARSSGEPELSRGEMHDMNSALGDVFKNEPWLHGDHGWAHEALLESSPDYAQWAQQGLRKRGPTFADMERAIGQRPHKLWYAWANRSVHATLSATGDEALRGLPRPDAIDPVLALTADALWVATGAFVLSWPSPERPDAVFGEFTKLLMALGDQSE